MREGYRRPMVGFRRMRFSGMTVEESEDLLAGFLIKICGHRPYEAREDAEMMLTIAYEKGTPGRGPKVICDGMKKFLLC